MEQWKDVNGFEGLYQVSNKGRVKSLDRIIKNNGSYSGVITRKEIILKQTTNRLGYKVITLNKDGVRFFKIVHRLVAESFIINKHNYKEVNHKDLDKANNTIENLEWCSRSQNINHYYNSKNTTSKFKGVSYQKDRDKWIAYIDFNKIRISLGRFDTEEQAYKKRELYIKELKNKNYEELI
jgi:hypothetical protein